MVNEKIAIVVDSGCDLKQEWLEEYQIIEIPLQVMIGDKTYLDRQEIRTDEVYLRLNELPKTSLPTGESIQTIFDNLHDQGFEQVLVFTISSALSGTYQLVSLLANEQEGMNIHVFDTKNMSIGAGLFALHAAKLRERGWQFQAIIDEVCQPSRSFLFGEVATLEHLYRGGRISTASAKLGTMLNIKPILALDEEGKVTTLAKVKGRKKMKKELLSILADHLETPAKMMVAVEGNDDLTFAVEEALGQYPDLKEVIRADVGAAFGVHVGPEITMIAVYRLY